jgi:hypothetical protein
MKAKTDSPQPSTNILRRTEFDKQLTQAVMERVLKQTIQLIAEVERKTPWRDQVGPDDRLNTAILKTLEGSRQWDPDRVDLAGQLVGIISSDIECELRRSKKVAHLSLEDDEHQDLEALQRETEDALAGNAPTSDEAPMAPVWTLAMNALREAARGERDVLRILDAYDQGAFTKRAVMRAARMRASKYDAAFARLVELTATIDGEICEIIFQAIA